MVRRNAVHSLSCKHCKPNGCPVDVRPLFERVIGDRSRLVRSMVLHVCSLHFLGHQWAVDLVADIAAGDPSAKLRASAETVIRQLNELWDSDDRRRELPPDLVRKTGRHAGRWVAIRDGRIAAVAHGQSCVFRRELKAGASGLLGGTRRREAPPDFMTMLGAGSGQHRWHVRGGQAGHQ